MTDSIRVRSHVKKFAVVEHEIIEKYLRVIGCNGFSLWCVLRKFADYDSGECYPKLQTIADVMGTSVSTVRRCFPVLVSNGFLSVESGAKQGKSNIYIVTTPETGCVNLNEGVVQIELPGSSPVTHPNKEELEPINNNQLTLSPASPSNGDLDTKKLFEYFCHQAGKTDHYILTDKRKTMAMRRWKETLKRVRGDVGEAKELFRMAISGLCENDFMRAQGLLEWEQLFRSEDNLNKWIDRYENPEQRKSVAL